MFPAGKRYKLEKWKYKGRTFQNFVILKLAFLCTDDNNQYSFVVVFPLLKTVNTNLFFPSRKKTINY